MYYADRREPGLGFLFLPTLVSAAVGLIKGKPKVVPPPPPPPPPPILKAPATQSNNTILLVGGGLLLALLAGSFIGSRD